MIPRSVCLLFGLLLSSIVFGQTLKDLVPPKAPHCAVTAAPGSAGAYVSPGGFLLVFPRNSALRQDYTGCKTLWVVDGERIPRLATLYFERGALRTAVAHDVRSAAGAPEAACSFPEGKSLMPRSGRRITDSGCGGFASEDLYGLFVPTWPRRCMTEPDAPPCSKDPE